MAWFCVCLITTLKYASNRTPKLTLQIKLLGYKELKMCCLEIGFSLTLRVMSETEAHKPICEYFQHVTKTKQEGNLLYRIISTYHFLKSQHVLLCDEEAPHRSWLMC